MSNETWFRICVVIGELTGIPIETISPGQCLGQKQTPNHYDPQGSSKPLQLDSLDLVQLAMHLEDEFGIQITDDEVDDDALNHVGGLVAFVQGKLDARIEAKLYAQPLELTDDMRVRTYGDLIKPGGPLVDFIPPAISIMASRDYAEREGNAKTPWRKAADHLKALGLNPEELLIPEWEWYRQQDARP